MADRPGHPSLGTLGRDIAHDSLPDTDSSGFPSPSIAQHPLSHRRQVPPPPGFSDKGPRMNGIPKSQSPWAPKSQQTTRTQDSLFYGYQSYVKGGGGTPDSGVYTSPSRFFQLPTDYSLPTPADLGCTNPSPRWNGATHNLARRPRGDSGIHHAPSNSLNSEGGNIDLHSGSPLSQAKGLSSEDLNGSGFAGHELFSEKDDQEIDKLLRSVEYSFAQNEWDVTNGVKCDEVEANADFGVIPGLNGDSDSQQVKYSFARNEWDLPVENGWDGSPLPDLTMRHGDPLLSEGSHAPDRATESLLEHLHDKPGGSDLKDVDPLTGLSAHLSHSIHSVPSEHERSKSSVKLEPGDLDDLGSLPTDEQFLLESLLSKMKPGKKSRKNGLLKNGAAGRTVNGSAGQRKLTTPEDTAAENLIERVVEGEYVAERKGVQPGSESEVVTYPSNIPTAEGLRKRGQTAENNSLPDLATLTKRDSSGKSKEAQVAAPTPSKNARLEVEKALKKQKTAIPAVDNVELIPAKPPAVYSLEDPGEDMEVDEDNSVNLTKGPFKKRRSKAKKVRAHQSSKVKTETEQRQQTSSSSGTGDVGNILEGLLDGQAANVEAGNLVPETKSSILGKSQPSYSSQDPQVAVIRQANTQVPEQSRQLPVQEGFDTSQSASLEGCIPPDPESAIVKGHRQSSTPDLTLASSLEESSSRETESVTEGRIWRTAERVKRHNVGTSGNYASSSNPIKKIEDTAGSLGHGKRGMNPTRGKKTPGKQSTDTVKNQNGYGTRGTDLIRTSSSRASGQNDGLDENSTPSSSHSKKRKDKVGRTRTGSSGGQKECSSSESDTKRKSAGTTVTKHATSDMEQKSEVTKKTVKSHQKGQKKSSPDKREEPVDLEDEAREEPLSSRNNQAKADKSHEPRADKSRKLEAAQSKSETRPSSAKTEKRSEGSTDEAPKHNGNRQGNHVPKGNREGASQQARKSHVDQGKARTGGHQKKGVGGSKTARKGKEEKYKVRGEPAVKSRTMSEMVEKASAIIVSLWTLPFFLRVSEFPTEFAEGLHEFMLWLGVFVPLIVLCVVAHCYATFGYYKHILYELFWDTKDCAQSLLLYFLSKLHYLRYLWDYLLRPALAVILLILYLEYSLVVWAIKLCGRLLLALWGMGTTPEQDKGSQGHGHQDEGFPTGGTQDNVHDDHADNGEPSRESSDSWRSGAGFGGDGRTSAPRTGHAESSSTGRSDHAGNGFIPRREESDLGGGRNRSAPSRASKKDTSLESGRAISRILGAGDLAYDVLDVGQLTSQEDIKKAYRKLAVLVHPDKSQHPNAQRAFQTLQSAHDKIGDKESRQIYDTELRLQRELKDNLNWLHTQMSCRECTGTHKKTRINRSTWNARFCHYHNSHHPAYEGDIWLETSYVGLVREAFMCENDSIYEITDWAKCNHILHLPPNACDVFIHRSYTCAGAQQRGNVFDNMEDLFRHFAASNGSGGGSSGGRWRPRARPKKKRGGRR